MSGAHSITAAIDSNILTYFLQASSGFYDPALDIDDHLRTERIAAFRLFLYGPKLTIVPAVTAEAEKIPQKGVRDYHLRWIWYSFDETTSESLDDEDVATRQSRYASLHSTGTMDCRAVAEAESAALERFLTFDQNLLKRLAGKTERIVIQTPSQCWADLALAPGTPPTWEPAPSNPLAKVDWWRW